MLLFMGVGAIYPLFRHSMCDNLLLCCITSDKYAGLFIFFPLFYKFHVVQTDRFSLNWLDVPKIASHWILWWTDTMHGGKCWIFKREKFKVLQRM